MSVQAITWAYNQDGLNGTQKFVLVTLANRADEEWSCFPSLDYLEIDTGLGERAIRNALDHLEKHGFIQRERQRNPDGSLGRYRYFLQRHMLPLGVPAARDAGGSKKAEKPAENHGPARGAGRKPSGTSCRNPTGTRCRSTKPNNNTRTKTLTSDRPKASDPVKASFDELWALTPEICRTRSKAKAKCLEAFRRSIETTPAETIIAAMRAYLAKTDERYVMGLHRWLSEGRYENFVQPVDLFSASQATDADQDLTAWRRRFAHLRDTGKWQPNWGMDPRIGVRDDLPASFYDEFRIPWPEHELHLRPKPVAA